MANQGGGLNQALPPGAAGGIGDGAALDPPGGNQLLMQNQQLQLQQQQQQQQQQALPAFPDMSVETLQGMSQDQLLQMMVDVRSAAEARNALIVGMQQQQQQQQQQLQQQQQQLQQQQQQAPPRAAITTERSEALRLAAGACGRTDYVPPHLTSSIYQQATTEDMIRMGLIPQPVNRQEDPTVYPDYRIRGGYVPAASPQQPPLDPLEARVDKLSAQMDELARMMINAGTQHRPTPEPMTLGTPEPRGQDEARKEADFRRIIDSARKVTPPFILGSDFDEWWRCVRTCWISAGLKPDAPGQDVALKGLLYTSLVWSDTANNDTEKTLTTMLSLLNPYDELKFDNFQNYLDRIASKLRSPAKRLQAQLEFQSLKQRADDNPILYSNKKLQLWIRSKGVRNASDSMQFFEAAIRGIYHPIVQQKLWDKHLSNLDDWVRSVHEAVLDTWRRVSEGLAPAGTTTGGLRMTSVPLPLHAKKSHDLHQLDVDEERMLKSEEVMDEDVMYEAPDPSTEESVCYAVNSGGERRRCFDCGSMTHF